MTTRPLLALPALLLALGALPLHADAKKPAKPSAQVAPPPFTAEDHTDADGARFEREPHEAAVHTRHGTVVKKAPIKHVPVDHVPFRKLAGPDGTVALPNGKRIGAADFHAQVSHAERSLNGLGHSLRTAGGKERLVHHAPGHLAIQKGGVELLKAHKPVKGHKPSTLADRQKHHAQLLALHKHLAAKATKAGKPKGKAGAPAKPAEPVKTAVAIALPPSPLPSAPAPEVVAPVEKAIAAAPKAAAKESATTTRSWDLSAGDKDHFSAYLRGKVDTTADGKTATLAAHSEAGGTVFGKGGELLKLEGLFVASTEREQAAKLDLSVAGKTAWSMDARDRTLFTKGDRIERTLDVSATIPIFSLGIISVQAKMGILGSAGVDFAASLAPRILTAHVRPFVHTSVYVQASVNALIAEAGAIGRVTLLNDDLELFGAVAIVPTKTADTVTWGAYSQLILHNQLEMLNGDVSAFVKLYFPCWKSILPSICNKQYDVHLFGWKGIKNEGQIFALSEFTPLLEVADPGEIAALMALGAAGGTPPPSAIPANAIR